MNWDDMFDWGWEPEDGYDPTDDYLPFADYLTNGQPENSFLYIDAKLDILNGRVGWVRDHIEALLVAEEYDPQRDHRMLGSDLPLDMVISRADVTGKYLEPLQRYSDEGTLVYVSALCKAAPTTFPLDPNNLGFQIGYVVLVYEQDKLLACLPLKDVVGVEYTITVSWDAETGIFSF